MTIDMHEAALAAAVRWRFLCSSKKDPEVTFDFGLPFFFFHFHFSTAEGGPNAGAQAWTPPGRTLPRGAGCRGPPIQSF